MKPRIKFDKVALGILTIQLLFFALYITVRFLRSETPVVSFDPVGYYGAALRIFEQFSLGNLQGIKELILSLRNAERPVFDWPAIILLRLSSNHLNYQLITIVNTAFYHLVLAFSIYKILKLLGSSPLTIITAISSIWAMPTFFNLSSALLGDIAVAAWIILVSTVLLTIQNSSYLLLKVLLLGIIATLGLQTKPIFLFYFVTAVISLAVLRLINEIFIRGISYKVFSRKILSGVIVFTLTSSSLGYLIFPRNLPILIKELAYNNETLGYWKSQVGIFNSYLWFPTVVFNEISIFPAFIFTVILLATLIKSLFIIKSNNMLEVKNSLTQIFSFKGSFIFITFIILVIYSSFLVVSKDSRTFFFLLPIFIIISLYIIEVIGSQSERNQRIYKFLIFSILIFNISNTISWNNLVFPNRFFLIFNQYLNLPNFEIYSNIPSINNVITYEDLGVFEALELIEKDCKPKCTKAEPASVFIPHSSAKYNNSVFVDARLISHDFKTTISSPDIEIPFKFTTAIYNYGGWGLDGGIPRSLFTSEYIILIKDNLIGQLSGNTEIYNKLIAEYLSLKKPEFIDGLVKIYESQNRLGDKVIVYKRQNLPSVDNFIKIVQILTAKDFNNFWNVPFIYAALQINSQLPDLQRQLEQMSEINSSKGVRYHYGSPEQELKIQTLLKSPINTNKQVDAKYPYPGFLTGPR